MIQFNLLPDIKLEYIKARRLKRLVILSATVITCVALALTSFLILATYVVQAHQLSNLDNTIKTDNGKLQSVKDLSKILTVQNQLSSLPTLHSQKPVASRLFDYVGQVTPSQVNISKLSINFEAGKDTISIKGSTDTLFSVNQYVDTLKFTKYTTDNNPTEAAAFSNVVMSNFSRDDKGATYTVDLNFDPTIFDITRTVKLSIPQNFITTRSQVDQPTDLFQTPPATKGQ